MAIELKYTNNKVNASDSIKDFVGKYNATSEVIGIDLNEIKKYIDSYEESTYITKLMEGSLDKINNLQMIGGSTFGGDVLFRFGEDRKSELSISKKGFILGDRNGISDGIKDALVFTLDNADIKNDSPVPYQDVNLSTNELERGQIVILRIGDNANIYGNLYIKLVGYEDEQVLELSPNRPSITLMKSFDGDDRFLILSYPIIKAASGESSGGAFGKPGRDGLSAYELAYKNGLTKLDEISWLESLKGERGKQGFQGATGPKGEDGKSAFDIWKESSLNDKGDDATEDDFINSIIQKVVDNMSSSVKIEWNVID